MPITVRRVSLFAWIFIPLVFSSGFRIPVASSGDVIVTIGGGGGINDGVLAGSAGLGALFAGFVLEWIDWPVGSAIRTAADIPAETLLQLAIVWGPVIGLVAIPGALCFRGYRLDRKRVSEIQAALRVALSSSGVAWSPQRRTELSASCRCSAW